jgi:hypothetical protein
MNGGVVCIGFLWGSEQNKNRTREENNLEETQEEGQMPALMGTVQREKPHLASMPSWIEANEVGEMMISGSLIRTCWPLFVVRLPDPCRYKNSACL